MIITPIYVHQTGNGAWTPPKETMSARIMQSGMSAKVIAQRLIDHPAATEELVGLGNELIALAQDIKNKFEGDVNG